MPGIGASGKMIKKDRFFCIPVPEKGGRGIWESLFLLLFAAYVKVKRRIFTIGESGICKGLF